MRVFISYRHSDVPEMAGRLRDRLAEAFSETNVFFDVESIDFGVDFRSAVRETLATVDALVLVIGPRFAPDRLADPIDFIRVELTEALTQEKLIVPVVVAPATMPTPADLPDGLESLAYRRFAPLRPDPDFTPDAQRLIERFRRVPAPPPEPVAAGRSHLLMPGRLPDAAAAVARGVAAGDTCPARDLPVFGPAPADLLAFSPDGRLLAVGAEEDAGSFELWRPDLGVPDETSGSVGLGRPHLADRDEWGDLIDPPRGRVRAVVFPPDGRAEQVVEAGGTLAISRAGTLVAAADRRTAQVWDRAADRLLPTFAGEGPMAFSPDGSVLATGARNGVQLRPPRGGDGHALAGLTGRVEHLGFSGDGSLMVTAAEGESEVKLWATATGEHVASLAHDGPVTALASSPASRWLAVAAGDVVRLWDLTGG